MQAVEKNKALGVFTVTGAWMALAILCIVTVFAQLDRQLTGMIVAPLKQAYTLSDTQFSLLHGYAFAITYAFFALPLGMLVDRANRRNLIFCGMLLWCALTTLAAFAQSFLQLIITRLGVGIGEAVLAPAAFSLIADLFPVQRRGRAAGIYYMALAAGSGLSLMIGGAILRLLPEDGIVAAGFALPPWRLLFLCAGLPGIVVALLVLMLREPARSASTEAIAHPSVGAMFATIWQRRDVVFPVYFASAMMAALAYGAFAWAPTLYERRFGLPPSHSALWIGMATIIGSCLGAYFGGYTSDHWMMRGLANPRLRVMAFSSAALIPASAWAIMPWSWLCNGMLGFVAFCASVLQSAMPLALQEAVPPNIRGQVLALQYLILALIGFGAGPTVVALITDHVFGADAMLPWSLVCVTLPASLSAALACGWGLSRGRSQEAWSPR